MILLKKSFCVTGMFIVRVPECRPSFVEDSLQSLIFWMSADFDPERDSPKGVHSIPGGENRGHPAVLCGLSRQVGILLPMSDEPLDITGKCSE